MVSCRNDRVPGEEVEMFHTILLAVDGSDHSKKAISAAGQLAEVFHGEVIVCHVRERGAPKFVDLVREETDGESGELADQVARELKDSGISARPDHRATVMGRVAGEILAAASDHNADIIVMGSRGLGEFAALMIGSVTHNVLHAATCPVLVVR
jgi:nucleotide-binding universal stress UspA family protein